MTTEPSGETAPITSRIATLDGKICGLSEERAKLLQELNYIQSPVISRIPVEILSRIFLYATQQDVDIQIPCLADHEPLLVLRAVCSHWRRVTESVPRLWSSLTLLPKKTAARTLTTDYVGLVKQYCLRAVAISLYISDLSLLGTSTIDEIMRVLLEEYPWKLEVLCLSEDPDGLVLSSILKYAKKDVEFSQLRTLGLTWDDSENRSQGTSVFSNSPHLRTLALSADQSQQIPFEFPWTQITTLDISGVSLQYSLRLLVLCPNLVECKITHVESDPENSLPVQHPIISMQFLRRLAWFSLGSREGWPGPCPVDPQFFSSFRFPAVRELEWSAPLPSRVMPLVRDSFAGMQKIEKLEYWPIDELHECLSQQLDIFVNLTTLDAHVPDDDEYDTLRWLYRLTVRQGGENVLPRLQRLHLTTCNVGIQEMIVVLHSRRNGPVDWSDFESGSGNLILQPYDSNSTHWESYSRLMEFSSEFYEYRKRTDWSDGPHDGAMRAMVKEAREIKGFDYFHSSRSRIHF